MRKSTDDILKTGEGVQIMKRKTVLVLLLAALLISTVAAFAGCTDPESGEPMIVDGKTFVFDSVEIELTDEGKERMESMGMTIDDLKEMFAEQGEGMEVSFADGKITNFDGSPEYTQDGGDIIVDGGVFVTVKGNKLIYEHSDQGITSRFILVQK